MNISVWRPAHLNIINCNRDDLTGTSGLSGPNTIKLKMYNLHIFLTKMRTCTCTTSESMCLSCPIVVQF